MLQCNLGYTAEQAGWVFFVFPLGAAAITHATSGFELGFKPGIAIKLNKHFNFIAKYGFLGYRDDYMLGSQDGYGFSFSSEDLSIGFHYVF